MLPHRIYDCSIDLLPGSTIPKGRLYSLPGPEKQAIEKYISSSLQAGIIRSFSSPAGASFFFVEKKDKSLRPCIDYTGFNEITVKNRYPLPLISSAFDQLQGSKVFNSYGEPQTNGQAERLNQELETGLWCLSSQNPSSWSKILNWIEYAHNTLPSASTGLTQCVYGYQPPLFPGLEQEVNVPSANAMVWRCRRMWSRARQSLLHSSAAYKKAADRRRRVTPVYSPGESLALNQGPSSTHPIT